MTELTPALAELIARRFAVLGEPTRVRLLNTMHADGEASAGELTEAVSGTQANISKHLNLLLAEGMVSRRRDGTRAMYRIADPTLIALCDQVCAGVSKRLEELQAVVAEPERRSAA